MNNFFLLSKSKGPTQTKKKEEKHLNFPPPKSQEAKARGWKTPEPPDLLSKHPPVPNHNFCLTSSKYLTSHLLPKSSPIPSDKAKNRYLKSLFPINHAYIHAHSHTFHCPSYIELQLSFLAQSTCSTNPSMRKWPNFMGSD